MSTTSRALIAMGVVAALGAGALATTSDAAGTNPPATAAATRTVTLKNIAFTPKTLRIRRGDTVRWVWRDGVSPHNVTFRGGHPRTRSKQTGTYRRTFRRAGTFAYRCTLHPGMSGKVIVR